MQHVAPPKLQVSCTMNQRLSDKLAAKCQRRAAKTKRVSASAVHKLGCRA
ncbi:unnamed protein product [Penicillium camemberti]|uniref:Str. FM013 n=1 Tax=Penicillium camemberti (strain FM 013) TaxID=1429867 RepID=A0A0G4PFX9_PENC3|nr:unnamed protein product [Penicillium camemberti]